MSLLAHQRNVYSQNGEDGILEELCGRLERSAIAILRYVPGAPQVIDALRGR